MVEWSIIGYNTLMPRKWTNQATLTYRRQLIRLYSKENLSIFEVGEKLGLSYQCIFQRLKRLGIKISPESKKGYTNKRSLNRLQESQDLAEFIGIMLGDGHISREQIFVTLGKKEKAYVAYVIELFRRVYACELKCMLNKKGHHVLYIGFRNLVDYLLSIGLVMNKVKEQVKVPSWIFRDRKYIIGFLRGFFDTDGSIYKLKHGIQISFCNMSMPLLDNTRTALISLGFSPSKISSNRVYLTKKKDLLRYKKEIGSANPTKMERINKWVGTEVAKPGTL